MTNECDNNGSTLKIETISKYWIASWYRWCPTSWKDLEKAENKILSHIKCHNERKYVTIAPHVDIWTLICSPTIHPSASCGNLHENKSCDQGNVDYNEFEAEIHNNEKRKGDTPLLNTPKTSSSNWGEGKSGNGNHLHRVASAELETIMEHKIIHDESQSTNNLEKSLAKSSHNSSQMPNPKLPLILIHGFAAGLAFWAKNLDSFSLERKVYAFDLLGFGRSSRIRFSSSAQQAEDQFVDSIEKWRKALKIDKMILLGHSFGGYLATAYALKYPEFVNHLILCDPWGFPEKPPDAKRPTILPMWIRMATVLLQPFNPLALMRTLGPWGPSLVQKTRPDLQKKFTALLGEDDTSIIEYVYHCNAQTPSGESAFTSLTIPFGWAKHPMINRIGELDLNIPMTIIYGSRSWIDSGIGFQIKYLREKSFVDVKIISGAGHHVYADKDVEFNHIINSLCKKIDEGKQFLKK